ncbi:hypothetical protein BPO_0645 [Bergeyella porcorum]|uniref:Uncharacterized protein n=1 Tax=Bergeyella porcorum TaxID=1735111 RepID=A0AAU0F1W1_9FLAO
MKQKLIVFLILCVNMTMAQRIKTPIKAIDGETYKVGDRIEIGAPTNNGRYQSVLYTDRASALKVANTILGVLADTAPRHRTIPTEFADNKIRNFSGNIAFFKKEQDLVYAYVTYSSDVSLRILLDLALGLGEVKSKNANFKTVKSLDVKTSDNIVEPFSPNYNIEVVGAYGDAVKRTVTVEFTVTNKTNDEWIYYYGLSDMWEVFVDSKMVDFEGEQYTGRESSKIVIPSAIKMKFSVTFPSVLSNIEKISMVDIPMGEHRVGDTSIKTRHFGSTIFRNIPVKWNDTELNSSNNDKGYAVKVSNKDVEIEILSVVGDKASQKVNVEYSLKNTSSVNQDICLKNSYATDSDGNMYNSAYNVFINKEDCNTVPGNVKLKAFMELSGISNVTKQLEFLSLPFSIGYNSENAEIRSLKIEWK